jgi:hypothetical protein
MKMKNQLPETYKASIHSFELPLSVADDDGNVGNIYYNDAEISATLEYVGFPKNQRKNISAVYVIALDGDYDAVWVCESSSPWGNSARFYALSFYRYGHISLKNAPQYWREDNPYYNK